MLKKKEEKNLMVYDTTATHSRDTRAHADIYTVKRVADEFYMCASQL